MNEWCIKQHGMVGYQSKPKRCNHNLCLQSGLTKAVQESQISLAKAEELMLKFVEAHTPQKKCPLGGNSVHCDKKFLEKHMKQFTNHLHYRIVDVSTVKELCKYVQHQLSIQR